MLYCAGYFNARQMRRLARRSAKMRGQDQVAALPSARRQGIAPALERFFLEHVQGRAPDEAPVQGPEQGGFPHDPPPGGVDEEGAILQDSQPSRVDHAVGLVVERGVHAHHVRDRVESKHARETTDGFRISEIDLKLRGPGEFFGTRQWGIPALRIANLLRDQEILESAKREAASFVEQPESREELAAFVSYLRAEWPRRYGLATVA